MHQFNSSVQKFDEYANEYASKFMDVSAYTKYLDIFCELTADKAQILEIACGPGNITKYIQEKLPNAAILATDLAPKMLLLAEKEVPSATYQILDARDILSVNQKFDAVMCSFCFPFLSKEDAKKFIEDCSKILNPDGILYISTMEGDATKAGFKDTSFGANDVYFNFHKRKDIEQSLLANNFSIEHYEGQDYKEKDGSISVDMMFIAKLKNE